MPDVTVAAGVATVTLARGKVNALDEATVDDLRAAFRRLTADDAVRAVVLTGSGSFFSFGWDVPALYAYPKEAFRQFVTKFTDLYAELYLHPRPLVAALNGHTVAGGCMLAIACDLRLMVSGKAT